MNKRCNCVEITRQNKDVSFDELIMRGLICEACVRNYRWLSED
ncbi:MAG: hypothetical protein AABY09_01590 [Nanoarchaeota archaeon]